MKNKNGFDLMQEMKDKIRNAQMELRLAEQNENYADPEFLDIAIERVKIARANLDSLYRMSKLM